MLLLALSSGTACTQTEATCDVVNDCGLIEDGDSLEATQDWMSSCTTSSGYAFSTACLTDGQNSCVCEYHNGELLNCEVEYECCDDVLVMGCP